MIERIPVLIKIPSYHSRFHEVVNLVSGSCWSNGLKVNMAPVTYKFTIPYDHGEQGHSVVLIEQDFLTIYPHVPKSILNAQIAQFAHKELGLLMVEGEEAINKVNRLKGSAVDPTRCGPDTWRFVIASRLGSRSMTLLGEDGRPNYTVHDNFIHVPNRAELDRDMSVFRRFI